MYLAPEDAPPRPSVSITEAFRRGWLLILIPVLLFAGLATYIAMNRQPTYTADSRLTVGRVDISPSALATFATATQSLASAYSRAVEANAVVNPVAKRLNVSSAAVRGATLATPVPESPVIRVTAKADSSKTAGARYSTVRARITNSSSRG